MSTVQLKCPCGKPLMLGYIGGEWVLGHFNFNCSPIINGEDANSVLASFLELHKAGHYNPKLVEGK